ncbi:ABC-F family ATP-binding cassette domain-containing protein [Clostridium formicaceticum]|uniref:ABC transporter n=1 Tax=Clostridium formicaceticum TaxID=1497 RepID=A0AAC9WH08_9CLOT|nr:ABC-F family ATP-binding cassette domain-containing protein [Clostridium formicaceticum]AOY77978.1 ABC transporter [Clostridium formicaceticum]ARE88602.1 putative ABC transporter ATP-binding protein [Clostridium formicaceticum]
MNLLSAENISKSYSEKQLLNRISFGINEGDKIGVIGINGTGKTTLLKIIAGLETPDEGRVIKGNAVRIEYLPQNPYFDAKASVLQQVFRGNSPVMRLIRDYQEAIYDPNTPNEKIIKLTHDMDALEAWNIESEAKMILTKLGIGDYNARVGTLSGGQRKRIALAAALIQPSELLILDEPTNHLDNDTIEWLEQYLNKRKGALLMITHDRYFLDSVVNEMLELDRGNIYLYQGNYSSFLEKKLEREQIEAANEKKRQNLLRKELAWIKRGAKARTTKQKARIDRFEKLSEENKYVPDESVEISVASTRLGKKVIEMKHINKSFDGKKVIDDFSYTLLRNDRIGIIGANGRGKSTLLNIMSSRLQPDVGEIEIGETVKIGVYAQENQHMQEDLRVIEYIKEAAEYVTTAEGDKITASQMLERFLFPSHLQWTPIGKLSGGEKRRLYLLSVLMASPNVLFLDEPTNDLDIETLTILEDYLEDFKGAVIAVSHDRYFLDRMAEKIFAFEDKGKIIEYTGNYSDFKINYAINKIEEPSHISIKKSKEADGKTSNLSKEKPLKFSFKEQREYEEIDDIIAGLEEKIQEKQEKIHEASSDYARLQQLLNEKEMLEQQLEEKMERWMYLNDLADAIAKEKQNK